MVFKMLFPFVVLVAFAYSDVLLNNKYIPTGNNHRSYMKFPASILSFRELQVSESVPQDGLKELQHPEEVAYQDKGLLSADDIPSPPLADDFPQASHHRHLEGIVSKLKSQLRLPSGSPVSLVSVTGPLFGASGPTVNNGLFSNNGLFANNASPPSRGLVVNSNSKSDAPGIKVAEALLGNVVTAGTSIRETAKNAAETITGALTGSTGGSSNNLFGALQAGNLAKSINQVLDNSGKLIDAVASQPRELVKSIGQGIANARDPYKALPSASYKAPPNSALQYTLFD